MDKGKKPITQEEEEEYYLSLLDNYHTNYFDLALPPTPLAPPDYNILSQLSGFTGAPNVTTPYPFPMNNGMDQMMNKEDIYSKFLSMSFVPEPAMQQYYSLPPASNGGVVLPPPLAEQAGHDVVMPPPAVQDDRDVAFPPLLADQADQVDETADDDDEDLLLTISQSLNDGRPPKLRRIPAPEEDDGGTDKPLVFRKAMPPDVLAEVSVFDPQRAKRIVTNRMSASRAKEKKKLYMYTLEHRVQNLKAKSTNLNAELTSIETESKSLNAENSSLKTEMDRVIQKMHWQDSLNDQIRGEIEHMKAVLGPQIPNLEALIGSGSSQLDMISAPLGAAEAQQLAEPQLQRPYHQEEQQAAQVEFQHQYLGLHYNSGIQGYDQPGHSLLQQQLPLQNPQPQDLYDEIQNEEERCLHKATIFNNHNL